MAKAHSSENGGINTQEIDRIIAEFRKNNEYQSTVVQSKQVGQVMPVINYLAAQEPEWLGLWTDYEQVFQSVQKLPGSSQVTEAMPNVSVKIIAILLNPLLSLYSFSFDFPMPAEVHFDGVSIDDYGVTVTHSPPDTSSSTGD